MGDFANHNCDFYHFLFPSYSFREIERMIVQRCRNFDLTQDEHHVDNEVMDERFTFLPEVGFPPNRTSSPLSNAVLTASLFVVVVVGLPQHSLRCRESLLRTPAL